MKAVVMYVAAELAVGGSVGDTSETVPVIDVAGGGSSVVSNLISEPAIAIMAVQWLSGKQILLITYPLHY